MKIGILGGSFDPIHYGHLVLAESVRDALDLQKIIFIPARISPHKLDQKMTQVLHRKAMVEHAIRLNPRFEISEIEIKREGPSFTIDTMKELHQQLPGNDFTFIIGADSIEELSLWKDIDGLIKLCRFAVGSRSGFQLKRLDSFQEQLPKQLIESMKEHLIEIPTIGISSSDIRRRIRHGKSIRHLVPNIVLDYIRTHRLYESEK